MCDWCGCKFDSEITQCPECGDIVNNDNNYCNSCGASFCTEGCLKRHLNREYRTNSKLLRYPE